MQELVIFFKILLYIVGGVATIGGATAVMSRWASPYKTLKKELEDLKTEFATLKNHQNTDHRELQKMEQGIEKICKCTLAITDHELTGNSVDKLREAKDEMQDFLIHK